MIDFIDSFLAAIHCDHFQTNNLTVYLFTSAQLGARRFVP